MIELYDVHKSYGAIQVLSSINIQVCEGECLAVIGKSGTGKTTLLKIIGTLAMPDKGVVKICSVDVTKAKNKELASLRRNIGFSFQQPLLLPYMTVIENVMLTSNMNKKEVIEILNFIGLGERINHKPAKLSEGEKKRVDLARALAKKPRILIADEPFSNLDSECIEKVSKLINDFLEKRCTVIVSSNNEIKSLNLTHIFRL